MAELLAGNAAGFVGFEAVSSALSSEKWKEPQETKTGDQDPVNYGAGAEFQVVMKQLGKRDTTTKLKVRLGRSSRAATSICCTSYCRHYKNSLRYVRGNHLSPFSAC